MKYRALDDGAVTYDGEMSFSKEQAEIAYFGLMYDKESKQLYYSELTKEDAEKFEPSKEVKQAYEYGNKKNI